MSFTWEGLQLKTAVADGKNPSYTYDDNGIRTSKTVDGVTTNYFLDGSTILAQKPTAMFCGSCTTVTTRG